MEQLRKYNQVFMEAFSRAEGELTDKVVMGETTDWDSIGHVNLITSMEDVFDIMFETEDILEFTSYTKGKEILKKYNIYI